MRCALRGPAARGPWRWLGRWLWPAGVSLLSLAQPAAASSATDAAAVTPPAAPAITSVQQYAARDAARIVLHVSQVVRFEPGRPDSAERLHVDVDGVSYAGPTSLALGGLVERVRLLPVGAAWRVAIDTSVPATLVAFYLPEPFRIVIDVARRAARPAAPRAPGRTVGRIALDPGHGGSDPGAIGALGAREKDVALDVALLAAPLLARELGIDTLLTRDSDVHVPLEERVARANAFQADLFVSIHCNAERTGSARGVMTFVLDDSHPHAAVSLLARENATVHVDGGVLSRFAGQFDDAGVKNASRTFAQLLQRSTLASLAAGYPGALDGGVHGAGFYVLAGAHMPAVLFETSFISHAQEERALATERYRQKLADGIVNAVRAYRAGYRPPGVATPER